VGERVLAYNPKTGKMEQKPILHVWINHDHDLVDLLSLIRMHNISFVTRQVIYQILRRIDNFSQT